MIHKVKGWFSGLFGFGGDDDGDKSDPDQFTPTEKDLKGALSRAGVYGLLAEFYDTGKFQGKDLSQVLADKLWPKITSILDKVYPTGTAEGSDADVRLRNGIGSLKGVTAWVKGVKSIQDRAVEDAEFMNKGFGDMLVKAVNKVPIVEFKYFLSTLNLFIASF